MFTCPGWHWCMFVFLSRPASGPPPLWKPAGIGPCHLQPCVEQELQTASFHGATQQWDPANQQLHASGSPGDCSQTRREGCVNSQIIVLLRVSFKLNRSFFASRFLYKICMVYKNATHELHLCISIMMFYMLFRCLLQIRAAFGLGEKLRCAFGVTLFRITCFVTRSCWLRVGHAS